MKWIVIFADGASKIAFGPHIAAITDQIKESDSNINDVVSIQILSF